MNKKYFIVVLFMAFSLFLNAQESAIKYIEVYGNQPTDIIKVYQSVEPYVYKSAIDLSRLDVQKKKEAFINLMLPSILIAKKGIEQEYNLVLQLIDKEGTLSKSEISYLNNIKKIYKCDDDTDFLSRLKTHPTSIIIAQAAIESGWGTSRFYKDANNLFGVWSYNVNEPRIQAMETREGKAVYVKKYDSLPESIDSYFKTIARGPYVKFRAEREKTDYVYQLIPHLKVYSELGEEYVERLEELIRYNKLEQYDDYQLNVNE